MLNWWKQYRRRIWRVKIARKLERATGKSRERLALEVLADKLERNRLTREAKTPEKLRRLGARIVR